MSQSVSSLITDVFNSHSCSLFRCWLMSSMWMMWHPLFPKPMKDPSKSLRASQDLGSGPWEPAMKTLGSTAKWSTASPVEITRVSIGLFCWESDLLSNPYASICVSERVSLSSCQMSSWFLQWRASFGWGRTSSWTERQQPSITSQSQPETWEPRLATARWGFITQTYTCKQPHTLIISSWAIRVLQISLLCCKFNNNIQKHAFPTSNRWFVRFVHDI